MISQIPNLNVIVVAVLTAVGVACGSQTNRDEVEDAVRLAGLAEPDTVRSRTLPPRGEAWVVLDSDTVHAEVAATAEAREQGLMNRTELPDGTGMLFVFTSEAVRSFWMRNTLVPLDIAFFDSAMRIVDIQQMEPETEEYHTSRAPAMFALEVPEGWLEERGVSVGDQAEIVFGPR